MRGKQRTAMDASVQRRIIPAHAGQTTARCARQARWPDHPRACGANPAAAFMLEENAGSSPRMRGKRVFRRTQEVLGRIIPAHAGQTASSRSPARATSDHPRACGANVEGKSRAGRRFGSSPRMRGKPPDGITIDDSERIIPAHAGQTAGRHHPCRTRPDHPRACGANAAPLSPEGRWGGSSPRMRGKHPSEQGHKRMGRIIPAHAGQTQPVGRRARILADHPRACGANGAIVGKATMPIGSSPRMRGKLLQQPREQHRRRIIPAHAGQTKQDAPTCSGDTDHPRACGANCAWIVLAIPGNGSSPRMRGKRGELA